MQGVVEDAHHTCVERGAGERDRQRTPGLTPGPRHCAHSEPSVSLVVKSMQVDASDGLSSQALLRSTPCMSPQIGPPPHPTQSRRRTGR